MISLRQFDELVMPPALIRMGIMPLAAHLFIFYYAALCAITPPVAVGAYVAGGIAGTHPMRTAVEASRLALVAYIVPFFFVYQPELIMQGSPGAIALAVVTAMIGVAGIAVGLQGYLLRRVAALQRLLFLIGGFLLLYPDVITDLVGIGLLIPILLRHIRRRPAPDS